MQHWEQNSVTTPTDTDIGITVTAPSSPEASFKSPINVPSASPFTQDNFDFQPLDVNLSVPTSHNITMVQPKSHFEEMMRNADLPESGPAHFHARRALWCQPIPNPTLKPDEGKIQAQKKLEDMVNSVDTEGDDDEVWSEGLERIWKGIITGQKLKRTVPLRILIRILQAGWVHDGTWPRRAVAPPSDEENGLGDRKFIVPSIATSTAPSGMTTPIPASSVNQLDANLHDIQQSHTATKVW